LISIDIEQDLVSNDLVKNLIKEVRYKDIPFPVSRGEKNSEAKLTESKVKFIISLSKAGYSNIKIGKAFKVDSSTIYLIVKNKSWRHIDRSKIESYVNFAAEIKCENLFI